MVQPDRRLVPIVSLDVVGYSRLVQRNERQTLRIVQRVYDRLITATIGDLGGKIFKTMGDGLLAEFGSVVAAVQWTADLQRAMHKRPVKAPGNEILQIRAGIVLADVLVSGDDLYGSGVNMAVRVQSHAPPGGICITKWMHQYLEGATDLDFVDMGPTELKNIAKTVRIFVWHPESAQVRSQPTVSSRAVAQTSRPSVAVLPFDNLSSEADQSYFADAVAEEITATLSRVKDFFVIARNSAFSYKTRGSVDVRQIGRELGVRYVVEGSVRRFGDRVRITVQLVETDSGNHIWSTRVDGAMGDLFDLQDRIAAEVASAIQPSIRHAEIERARSKRPESLAAYDLVMRAFPQLWAHRPDENRQAIALLERALELEPGYGLAAALAAWAHGQQIAYNWSGDFAAGAGLGGARGGGAHGHQSPSTWAGAVPAARAAARELVEQAVMWVHDDPTALTALATAMMQLGGDVPQALSLAEHALSLDPNHAWAWMRKGFGRVYLGDPENALTAFENAARLSPRDPFAFNVHLGMGLAHFAANRPREAIRFAQQALAERPGLTWPFRDLAVYHAHAGDIPAAIAVRERFVQHHPGVTLAAVRDGLRFMNSDLLARYLDGLERAGLA